MRNEISDLVNEYYEAIFTGNEETQQRVLDSVQDMIYLLLVRWGTSHINELMDLFDELPNTLSYSPSDKVTEKVTTDFQDVLIGLKARIEEELEKEWRKEEHSEDDILAVIAVVKVANYWQVERIIDSEDHIIEENAELDVIDQLFIGFGYNLYKTWVAILDERTCIVCETLNGTTIPFTDSFVYNEGEISLDTHYSDFAHAHSHCRCRLEYNLERS